MMRKFGARREWRLPAREKLYAAAFSPEECAKIVGDYGAKQASQNKVPYQGKIYRDTDIRWIRPKDPTASWIFQRLEDIVSDWNRDFGFEIEESGDLQLGQYGPGQNYDWHTDMGGGGLTRRKLSVVTMLTPRDEYEGGILEILGTEGQIIVHPARQGDTVIFPAWIKHRVTPVTEGMRWSLVSWFNGPPFR